MGVVTGNKTSGTCRVKLREGVVQVDFTAKYRNGTTADSYISSETDFCNREGMDEYRHIYITKIHVQNGYSKWKADITKYACDSGWVNYSYDDPPKGDISGTTVELGMNGIKAEIEIVPTGSTYYITISAEKPSLPEYYILTFDANRGINPPDSIRGYLLYNYEVTIPSAIPERDGYTFKYWTMDKDGMGKPWYPGMSMTLVENTILYAQWEKNSITGSIECVERTTTSLTFEWSKSSNSNGNIKLIHNGAESSTKSTGTGASGTVKFTDLVPGALYTAELWCEGDRIAYCYGETSSRPKTYTIDYEPNRPSDATGKVTNYPDPESFEDGQAIVSTQTPKCAGYRFKEWNTKKDGTGLRYAGGETFQIVSDITLYAIWQCYRWFHPGRKDVNGNMPSDVGNMPSNDVVDIGKYVTIPAQEPTRPGWTFLCWSGDKYSDEYGDGSLGEWYQGVSIALTESVHLYAKWERNAKLAKPIVTKYSKTETSITVKVDKNGGYGGYWEVTAWIDGEYTSTHRYSEEDSPFYITFRNLSHSTLYEIKATHWVDGVGEKESEAIRIRTNIPTFNWTTDDSVYIKAEVDLSNDEASPLKAEKWNELTKLIQTCQTINSGGNTYFTSASKGTEITAQIFNEVAYALGDLNGGAIPAKGEPVKAGEDILASYFAGNTRALKETINGISEEINRKT